MRYPSQPKKILVPVDLSEVTPELLAYVGQLARHNGAALEVLFVWEPPRFLSPELSLGTSTWTLADLEGNAVDRAKRELASAVKAVDLSGVPVWEHVEVGGVVPSILRAAEKGKADLIVLTTHGRRGVERLLLGSVAQRVVAQAPCPVLMLKPAEGS